MILFVRVFLRFPIKSMAKLEMFRKVKKRIYKIIFSKKKLFAKLEVLEYEV